MMPPESFFWQIESVIEQICLQSPEKKKYINFEHLKKIYSFQNNTLSAFQLKKNPDFTPSQTPVFTDEKNKTHHGLQTFSVCFHTSTPLSAQKPIYFVDNHQNALLSFFDFYTTTKKPISVVHIDAHRDDALFSHDIIAEKTEPNLQKILEQCQVSDYLDAGKKMGIIGTIDSYTQSNEFKQFTLPYRPYILNLDIDIYGPEGSAVDTKLKTEVITKAWLNADMVCLATSPAFIDQRFAAKLGKIFYQHCLCSQ